MNKNIYKVESIGELHDIIGIDKPRHPLLTIVDYSKVDVTKAPSSGRFVLNVYSVNFKKNCRFKYGRQTIDHKEDSLHCTAPGQIISFEKKGENYSAAGLGLFFHPELIRNSSLGKKINSYSFFPIQIMKLCTCLSRKKQN